MQPSEGSNNTAISVLKRQTFGTVSNFEPKLGECLSGAMNQVRRDIDARVSNVRAKVFPNTAEPARSTTHIEYRLALPGEPG
jgi:hypothetical protein